MPRLTPLALPVLVGLAVFALAGCTASTPAPSPTPTPTATVAGPCDDVTVIVDFGVLDHPSIKSCADAGAASDALAAAQVKTVGTADYGDAVVCRVNNEPAPDETVTIPGQAPFTESCNTLNSVAYWALWVKSAPTADWEYAQEGIATLQLTSGESIGLVYTPGTDSTPPQD